MPEFRGDCYTGWARIRIAARRFTALASPDSRASLGSASVSWPPGAYPHNSRRKRIGGKIPIRAGCLQDGGGEHATLIRHAERRDPGGVPGPRIVGDLAGTHGEENLSAVSGLDEGGRENSPLRGRQEREYEFRSLVGAALKRARREDRQGVDHRDDAA